jgi:hypothetical protein
MSKPGRQWLIRRYAFQALQEAFEDNGIPWARPEIKVRIEEGEDRTAAEKAGAGGAAYAESERARKPAAE